MAAPKGNKFAVGNKGGGMTSSYDPAYAKLAERACLIGFTDAELADLLGVSETTIRDWKLKHEDFLAALKAAKSHADDRVERSLFMRAIGYEQVVEKPMVVDKQVQIVQYREKVQPSTTAQIFWLKNRRPDMWRDIQQHEHGTAGEFSKLSDEELAQKIIEVAERLDMAPPQVAKKSKRPMN